MTNTDFKMIDDDDDCRSTHLMSMTESLSEQANFDGLRITCHERRQQIKQLKDLYVFDSEPEEIVFDRFTSMASRIFKTTYSFVNLLKVDERWYQKKLGIQSPNNSYPSFFSQAFSEDSNDIYYTLDASKELLFRNHPAVVTNTIRFFAAAPVVCDNIKIGLLTIFDDKARETFSLEDQMYLMDIAAIISDIQTEKFYQKMNQKKDAELIYSILHCLKEPLSTVETYRLQIARLQKNIYEAYDIYPSNSLEKIDELSRTIDNLKIHISKLSAALETSSNLGLIASYQTPTFYTPKLHSNKYPVIPLSQWLTNLRSFAEKQLILPNSNIQWNLSCQSYPYQISELNLDVFNVIITFLILKSCMNWENIQIVIDAESLNSPLHSKHIRSSFLQHKSSLSLKGFSGRLKIRISSHGFKTQTPYKHEHFVLFDQNFSKLCDENVFIEVFNSLNGRFHRKSYDVASDLFTNNIEEVYEMWFPCLLVGDHHHPNQSVSEFKEYEATAVANSTKNTTNKFEGDRNSSVRRRQLLISPRRKSEESSNSNHNNNEFPELIRRPEAASSSPSSSSPKQLKRAKSEHYPQRKKTMFQRCNDLMSNIWQTLRSKSLDAGIMSFSSKKSVTASSYYGKKSFYQSTKRRFKLFSLFPDRSIHQVAPLTPSMTGPKSFTTRSFGAMHRSSRIVDHPQE